VKGGRSGKEQTRSVRGAHGGRLPLLKCWPPCSYTLYIRGHHKKNMGPICKSARPPLNEPTLRGWAVAALGCWIRGGQFFSVGRQISFLWGATMGRLYMAPLAAPIGTKRLLYGRVALSNSSAPKQVRISDNSSCTIASSSPRSELPI